MSLSLPPSFLSVILLCFYIRLKLHASLVISLVPADDHLLLLCSSLQWQVFEEENRAVVRLLAGDNVEISRSLDPWSFNQFIPVDNFLHCRSEIRILMFLFSFFVSNIFKGIFIKEDVAAIVMPVLSFDFYYSDLCYQNMLVNLCLFYYENAHDTFKRAKVDSLESNSIKDKIHKLHKQAPN